MYSLGLQSGVLVFREDKRTCIMQLIRRLQGLRKQQREIPICMSRSEHAPSNKALSEMSEYGPFRQKRVSAKLWADPFSLCNVIDLMTPISSKCLSFLSGTLNYHSLVKMLLTTLSTHLLLVEQSILCKWCASKLPEWKLAAPSSQTPGHADANADSCWTTGINSQYQKAGQWF